MIVVGIIIPTRNSSPTIASAIESVLCQSFANWELLIIDGASNDDTVFKVGKFCDLDKRISVISEPDKGVLMQ
jgi:glycosyltransferase involved in cell wall biosynthesis